MALENTWEPRRVKDLTERERQVKEAVRRYAETLDDTELIELGVFAPLPKQKKEDG